MFWLAGIAINIIRINQSNSEKLVSFSALNTTKFFLFLTKTKTNAGSVKTAKNSTCPTGNIAKIYESLKSVYLSVSSSVSSFPTASKKSSSTLVYVIVLQDLASTFESIALSISIYPSKISIHFELTLETPRILCFRPWGQSTLVQINQISGCEEERKKASVLDGSTTLVSCFLFPVFFLSFLTRLVLFTHSQWKPANQIFFPVNVK